MNISRNILRIASNLENISAGEERRFVDYNKAEYPTGKPIFLQNEQGEIIGAAVIQSYDYFQFFARGRYKVLKIFTEEDRQQFLDMCNEKKSGKPLVDLLA